MITRRHIPTWRLAALLDYSLGWTMFVFGAAEQSAAILIEPCGVLEGVVVVGAQVEW